MGNGQSLKIIFDPDQQRGVGSATVGAGTKLRGKVALKLGVNYRRLAISLTFKGSERTYKTSQGRVGPQTKLVRQHDFFEKNLVLFDETNGEIKPGSHMFPFEIDLPGMLPKSTQSERKWKVKYTLSSRVIDLDRAHLPEHKCERTIMVLASPLPYKRGSTMAHPVTSNITTSDSVNKGTVSLGARVVNSIVGRGEDLKVSIACRNHSTQDIEQVKVQVIQEVVWFADDQRGPSERHETIIMEREDVDLPSLSKARQKNAILAVRNAEFDEKSTVHEKIQKEIQRDIMWRATSRNTIRLNIPKCSPNDYLDTYLGEIVKVSHFVKISLVTQGVASDHPFVQIPIRIGVSPPPAIIATLLTTHRADIDVDADANANDEDDYADEDDYTDILLQQQLQDEIPLVKAELLPTTLDPAESEAMAHCCCCVVDDDDGSTKSLAAAAVSEQVQAILVM